VTYFFRRSLAAVCVGKYNFTTRDQALISINHDEFGADHFEEMAATSPPLTDHRNNGDESFGEGLIHDVVLSNGVIRRLISIVIIYRYRE